MEFTKQEFDLFCKDLEECIKPLESKYGLKLKTGRIRYEDYQFECMLEARKDDGIDHLKEEFVRLCSWYDFKPEDYRREFETDNGERLRLIGFNLNKPKNCCRLESEDGKIYQCGAKYVQSRFILEELKSKKEGKQ